MARAATKGPTRRLTLDLSEPARERLENLRATTEADSLTEVVRRALAVYERLWDEQKRTGRVVIRGENGESDRELILV
jgi:hypothetical protein